MDKEKKISVVTIDATFSELPGSSCYQRGKGEGSSVRRAASRAITNLLNQPKLKRKRFSSFSATVSVGFRLEEQDASS